MLKRVLPPLRAFSERAGDNDGVTSLDGTVTSPGLTSSLSLLCEYLDSHTLPSFVAHLSDPASDDKHLVFDYFSPALREIPRLDAAIINACVTHHGSSQISELIERLLDARSQDGSSRTRIPMRFNGFLWTVAVVRRRWAVVKAMEHLENVEQSTIHVPTTITTSSVLASTVVVANLHHNATAATLNATLDSQESHDSAGPLSLGFLDGRQLGDPAFLKWVSKQDLQTSPCGAMNQWPSELLQSFEMALASPDPIALLWGSQWTLLYNASYMQLVGDKHPSAFGRPFAENWPNIAPGYTALLDEVRRTGKTIRRRDVPRFLRRGGYLEEVYANYSFVPVLSSPDKNVEGVFCYVIENTGRVLAERRIKALIEANDAMTSAVSLRDVWQALCTQLLEHSNDIQFAAIYTTAAADRQDGETPTDLTLEGSVRLDHNLIGQDGIFAPIMKSAAASLSSTVLSVINGTLSDDMLQRVHDCGVIAACRDIVIEPISCGVEGCEKAILVTGINPLRKADDEYKLFTRLLARQVESAVTIVRNLEKERKLSEAQVALEAESKFMHFAESAPIGFYMCDSDGTMVYCNKAFEELVGFSRAELADPVSWVQALHPDCLEEMNALWKEIVSTKGSRTSYVQFRKAWTPEGKDSSKKLDRTWGLSTTVAQLSETGEFMGTRGCTTDISAVKWADKVQAEKLSEALELKRQQENFLDTVSHEMRNPLSAILHCATELSEQLGQCADDPSVVAKHVDECATLAETIVYCANHQKRIIDDVLTLSKLDSRLLRIFPVATNPIKMAESVLFIFAPELRASEIKSSINIKQGYRDCNIDLALLDPHRVAQIVINLMSNAIKFMKGIKNPSLEIILDASSSEPEQDGRDMRYVPSGQHCQDPTDRTEWGQGEVIFLTFSVQDTGPGMTAQESNLLFNKFRQASPRTHAQYGGTGLGLFISRELAEMHGGHIGVTSTPGQGSMFSFYVKARKDLIGTPAVTQPPVKGLNHPTHPTHRRHLSTPPLDDEAHHKKMNGILHRDLPPPLVRTSSEGTTRVLIVEDNMVNQSILKKLLKKNGYEIMIANHGQEAIEIMEGSLWNISPRSRQDTSVEDQDITASTASTASTVTATTSTAIEHQPQHSQPQQQQDQQQKHTKSYHLDIVLCDIEMPVMDGKTFVKKVRLLQSENRFTSSIPVVAVTGNARAEQVAEALGCGFDDLITKPYQIADLLAKIEDCLAKARVAIGVGGGGAAVDS